MCYRERPSTKNDLELVTFRVSLFCFVLVFLAVRIAGKKILAAEQKEFVTEGTQEISRQSVARYMLDCLQHGWHGQKCVAIGVEK